MNLKEAFRYQNKLQNLLDSAQQILMVDKNILKTENTYLKSKATGGEVEDEVVIESPNPEYADKITNLAGFVLFLLTEKEKLYSAIREAKKKLLTDIDSETSLNAARQSALKVFAHMVDLRASESTVKNGGYGYRFNAEGNQITYKCDVKSVYTINYDRNVIKKYVQELAKKTDAVSTEIDRGIVNAEVGYECPFDVNDSFSEAFEIYLGTLG